MGLVILAAACLYLIGNDRIPLWDRDEPRYAQTSRQMLQSGNWVVPEFLGQWRTAKPPFVYWCQATAMAVIGDTPAAARLPSALAILGALGVLGYAIRRGVGGLEAVWTVLVLGSCLLVVMSAKMSITDGMLLLWVTIAQTCLFAIYHNAGVGRQLDHGSPLRLSAGERYGLPVVLWLAVGVAGLTKGPVALGVMGATLGVLAALDVGSSWRSPRAWGGAVAWWAKTRPVLGLAILALVCGPWLYEIHYRAPGWLARAFGHEIIERTRSAQEGHKGPPGFYLATIWGMYLPWSLLLPSAVMLAWKNRRMPDVRFSLAAVLGPWVMFEIVQTKLPHYLLPIYPPLAFLTADLLVRNIRREDRSLLPQKDSPARLILVIGITIWSIALAAVAIAPWGLAFMFGDLPWVAMTAFTAVTLAYVAVTARLLLRNRVAAGGIVMGSGMALVLFVLVAWLLPSLKQLQTPMTIGGILRNGGANAIGDAVMIDYKEPSLAFYQGGTIREESDNDYLTHTPPEAWKKWIVMSPQVWANTPKPLQERLERVATVHGLNYVDKSKPRAMDVIVAKKRD